MIAAVVAGAAGVYFLVARWESLPARLAVLAGFLAVIKWFADR
jgi:hypothetical protein